jgi:uridine kinase
LDGIFLLRPELIYYWDFSIFVDVNFDVSILRAVDIAVASSGGELAPQNIRAQYNQRYVPGQEIYFTEARPHQKADVVLQNNDLSNPKLIINQTCIFY